MHFPDAVRMYVGTLLCSVSIEALRLPSVGNESSAIWALSSWNKRPGGARVPLCGFFGKIYCTP